MHAAPPSADCYRVKQNLVFTHMFYMHVSCPKTNIGLRGNFPFESDTLLFGDGVDVVEEVEVGVVETVYMPPLAFQYGLPPFTQ